MKIRNQILKSPWVTTTIFYLLFCLGIFSNMLVISANGGKMPVYVETPRSIDWSQKSFFGYVSYFRFTTKNEVNFWYLADIIEVNEELPESMGLNNGIASIGDFLLLVGGNLAVFFGVLSSIYFPITLVLDKREKRQKIK